MKTNEDILNLVYEVNNEIDFYVDEGIVTILEKQDHKIQKLLRKLRFKIPDYKKTTLDEYASFVFINIDGKKNIRIIGEDLKSKYGDNMNPLYERLLLFINHMNENCNYIKKVNEGL